MSTETTNTGAASAALAYAARGWRVLPTKPDKAPRLLRGLLDASTNPSAIANWFALWPDSGLAIRTGAESGVVVLDVDPDHGGDDALAELERRHGEVPVTVECLTGGGGRHLYFAHPGGDVRNSAGQVGPGLDVRGDRGYVVCPPSRHTSGRRYEWSVDGDPDDVELAAMPGWLRAAGAPARAGRAREPASTWEKIVRDGLPHGERDVGLARLAGYLLARDVAVPVVYALVHMVNLRCRPPLEEAQVSKIVASIAGRDQRKRNGR